MTKQLVHGWGRHPKIMAEVDYTLGRNTNFQFPKFENVIAFGAGRSYGDTALNEHILSTRNLNHFIAFNESTGLLTVEGGVRLNEILHVFVPKGWFLPIVPGTKFITIGGAIASDVHGKNHHVDGCFSQCVKEIELLMPSGDLYRCQCGDPLFHATCGGIGLTGIIVSAKICLKRIPSTTIMQTTYKLKNLEETFDLFSKLKDAPYSVAWIDCLARGNQLGRSLLSTGHFSADHALAEKPSRNIALKFDPPSFLLNPYSVRLFNACYYGRQRESKCIREVYYDKFFFPLDGISQWNRMYGRNGFVQYQFILPMKHSYDGMKSVLESIAESGLGSFLAVLKLYGEENENLLSFPLKGYSLALDFRVSSRVFRLLDRIDEQVLKYGGRIYLAKDARMKRETFEDSYPRLSEFRSIRESFQLQSLSSLQARRLGI